MTLKQILADDINAVFNDNSEFASVAAWNGKDVNGQFLENYNEDAEAFYKLFWCAAADVVGIAVGNIVDVDTTRYRVVDINRETIGEGISLYLSEEL